LNVDAIQNPPILPPGTPGEGDSEAGPSKDPIVSVGEQAHAKTIVCDIHLTVSTRQNPDTPPHSQKPPKSRIRQAYSKRHQNNTHDDDMGALPKSAFVPPHLRKSATSGTASANAGTSGSVVKGAPPSPPPSQEPTPPKLNPAEPTTQELVSQEPKADPAESHQDTTWNGAVALDKPKPEAPPALRRENPRWPQTRGPRRTVWPKQRDMKPASTESSGDDDGGVTFRSNSNGDPFYDVKKLTDWNGDWLPPPEQWSARKGHTHRHFGQDIERWMNGHPDECLQEMDKTGPSFVEDGTCKEIVPKYWIVSSIEQGSLDQFWKLMPAKAPAALSAVSARPPFWERYEDGAFIESLIVPDAKVDPADLSNHFQGADLMASAEVRIDSIIQHRINAHKKSLAKQRRPIKETVPTESQLPDRHLIPTSNVFFRPVQPADVGGIAAVYNYYVEETIYANEFDPRTYQHIADRIDVIIKAGLPFLVAVSRDVTNKDSQVVGFACLDDYCDQFSMYRYTFELELYVHPGYVRQNIGSCLLDRLLEMSNTSYNARGGYEWINDSDYLKTGPSRVIKTIMLTVFKENGDNDENEYDFLKKFKFIRTGHIPNMGYKLGKAVDVVLYRHVTSEPIHPHVRP
jgi:L-amino acid N-acyltransferase YncA